MMECGVESRFKWLAKLFLFFSIGLLQSFGSYADQSPEATPLSVIWTTTGVQQELKTWNRKELLGFKKIISHEKAPASGGKVIKWEGILLSQFLDKALESLPADNRAQVDLIVLKDRNGRSAYIPRALAGKYPLMLALQWDSNGVSELEKMKGLIYSIVPWTSKSKILNEDLPLETFFVADVAKIELANYRDRFGTFFLKRRTDPSAIRGEKLFVQNCACCHLGSQGVNLNSLIGKITEEKSRKFASEGHPAVTPQSSIKLNQQTRRYLFRYLEAHRLENPVENSTPAIHAVNSR